MSREVRIARNGELLGTWPYDIVFAKFRCGLLLATDTVQGTDMEQPRPLAEVVPPPPSNSKRPVFVGRDDDECAWTFYCRDGLTVVGPRPIDEVIALMLIGGLGDNHLIFIAGDERWMSVANLMRILE
jgi:hypothetical protein